MQKPKFNISHTSLYATLGIIVVSAVLAILSANAAYLYVTTKVSMIEQMKSDSSLSIKTLRDNIAGLIASYAVNEYEKLVLHEMERHDYQAIIVEDYNLGKILGGGASSSGKIRNDNGLIVDFDAQNPDQRKSIDRSFHADKYDVIDDSGQKIAVINIYMSDRKIGDELDKIIANTISNAVGISLLLILSLFLGIRRFILRPLDKIDRAIRNCDADGIPLEMIPLQGPLEIAGLSRTMNGMIASIRESRAIQIDQQKLLLERKEALRESEHKLDAILQTVIDGIVTVDLSGQITYSNPAALDILKINKDEITGRYFQSNEWRQVDESGKPFPLEQLPLAIALRDKQAVAEVEHGIIDSGGTLKWLSVNAAPLFGDNGQLTGGVASFRDVTERKQADAKLQQFKLALDTTRDGFWILDSKGFLLEVNQAYADIVGYGVDELHGMHISQLDVMEQSSGEAEAHIAKVMEFGYDAFETRHRHKDGSEIDIEVSTSYEPVSQNFVAFCRDIRARKEAEKQIANLAFYDPLTGLPNRRLLQDRLSQSVIHNDRHNKKSALLFVDLDNFKSVNDTLGHDVGDQLLQQAAQRLLACVRAGDTVARSGGDEFVVILHDLSADPIDTASRAGQVGEKMLEALNQPYQLGGHECLSSSSIGLTLFGGERKPVEEMLRQADIAMYQAKKFGRNTLRFFDPQMQESINSNVALERELRAAVEGNEFQLYFQVQVDRNSNPIGAEALIRWISPERGFVSPAEFIPMAEDSGLIIPIGNWVIESACEQLSAWQQHAATCELTLAVNVSAKQFRRGDFVSQVQAAIDRYRIDPKLLKLELTESILLESVADTIYTMNELKGVGVRLSLDDFGTGYSSLQYLKRLPLDQVKIDQSFVRDIITDSNDKAIVRTIISMASNLNLDAIAEGVETEAQRQLLLKKGCRHFQGYFFGKPMPIEQFEVSLQSLYSRL
ncbi:MAG: EAL domain-containing protein [Gallionella sp.]|nr:EAL domain-containing protein [Gallionella sp.]